MKGSMGHGGRRRSVTSGIVLALACLAGVALAKTTARDRQFLDEAYSVHQSEMDLGALARERAATPALRQLGLRMMRDHTRAIEELRMVAEKDHLPLAAVLLDSEVQSYKRLSSLHGEAFDAAYAEHLVDSHDAAIALFTREALHGRNRDLRDYAARTLPMLRGDARRASAERQRL